ncbi:MAG: ATP-binding protein [Planctomycetota bacterium]|nr:ATP-binding protein [Planctomycetota bacterium]
MTTSRSSRSGSSDAAGDWRGGRRGGAERRTEMVRREMVIPNDTACLRLVRRTVAEVIAAGGFPRKDANLIALSVDEALANIMEHAYAGCARGEKEIEIILEADPERFEVVLYDSGREFDPSSVPEVNIEEHVRAGRKNGLGLFLMRQIMDEVNYSFQHNVRNRLQMIKFVDSGRRRAKRKTGE